MGRGEEGEKGGEEMMKCIGQTSPLLNLAEAGPWDEASNDGLTVASCFSAEGAPVL